MFFTMPEQVRFITIVMAGILLLPLFASHVTLVAVISGPFGFVLVVSLLIVVLSLHRSQLEAHRQAHLHMLEARHRRIMEASFDAILIHRDGRLIEVSTGFPDSFGYEQATHLTLNDLIAEQRASRVEGDAHLCEVVMRRQDGSTFFAEMVTIDQI